MKKAFTILLAASVAGPAPLFAQSSGQMISLEEAITVTLTENPALKAAAYEERAAQQGVALFTTDLPAYEAALVLARKLGQL